MSDSKPDRKNPRLWGPVDLSIWKESPKRSRVSRLAERLWETVSLVGVVGVALFIPLFFPLSIVGLYSIVGAGLLGPAVFILWSGLAVAFILVAERKGFSRNFASWEFPLKRILVVPLLILLAVGIIFLLSVLHL